MRHSTRAFGLAAWVAFAASAAAPARADFVTRDFTYSGTVTSLDDQTSFQGQTVHLLGDVPIGSAFSGHGTFGGDTQPGSDTITISQVRFAGAGTDISFDYSTSVISSSYRNGGLFLSINTSAGGFPAHVALPPSLEGYDLLDFAFLSLDPAGPSSLLMLFHHSSLLVRNDISATVTITSFSIVPEPGAWALLGVGLVVTAAGLKKGTLSFDTA